MNETIILAAISVLGGALGAKVVDVLGQRQSLSFQERASQRTSDEARIAALERRVDEMREEVAQWQVRYLEAKEHVQRCESELAEIRTRVQRLEGRE